MTLLYACSRGTSSTHERFHSYSDISLEHLHVSMLQHVYQLQIYCVNHAFVNECYHTVCIDWRGGSVPLLLLWVGLKMMYYLFANIVIVF